MIISEKSFITKFALVIFRAFMYSFDMYFAIVIGKESFPAMFALKVFHTFMDILHVSFQFNGTGKKPVTFRTYIFFVIVVNHF